MSMRLWKRKWNMSMSLDASRVTVELDYIEHLEALVVQSFPNQDDELKFTLFGTLEDLRGVVDTMSGILDELEADR